MLNNRPYPRNRPLTAWLEETETATLYCHTAEQEVLGAIKKIGSF